MCPNNIGSAFARVLVAIDLDADAVAETVAVRIAVERREDRESDVVVMLTAGDWPQTRLVCVAR